MMHSSWVCSTARDCCFGKGQSLVDTFKEARAHADAAVHNVHATLFAAVAMVLLLVCS
jgi:hypothetical protein